jgi:hypothetical protein
MELVWKTISLETQTSAHCELDFTLTTPAFYAISTAFAKCLRGWYG